MSSKERKALGRGFGALLKSVDEYTSQDKGSGVFEVDIEEISVNPKQPRRNIDEVKLQELAQSIKTRGVIQPILVRLKENSEKKYELVAGERRLRASKLAGFDKIPVLIRPIKDKDLLEIALIENIQRDDLNPIEESIAYRDLLEEHGYTQEDLSKRVGKNRSTIANFIRLLQLPEEIQNDLSAYHLTTGHARALLAIENAEEQIKLRDRIIEENISVRETEEIIRDRNKAGKVNPARKEQESSAQVKLNAERLRDHFATKVKIKQNGQKGKIELEYYSQEDFNRIFSLLIK